jgi:ADP-ribose pyrophosphatase YjhB (NUDIX family)
MMRRQKTLRSFGGLWVFPGGAVDAAEGAHVGENGTVTSAVAAAAAAACRELTEEAGLSLAADALCHFAHWITPSTIRRRFDTHFFVAAAPVDREPRIADAESSELQWVNPEIWEATGEFEDFPLSAPTLVVLHEIAVALKTHGSLEQLLVHERGRQVRSVLPKMLDNGVVALPWDPDYGALPGEGIVWDADGIAERLGWPSRIQATRTRGQ